MEDNDEKQDYEQDWPGLPIGHLILSKKDHFIVFLDKDNFVDWKTSDNYDATGYKDSDRHYNIINLAAKIESIPSDHHDLSIRTSFKRMIGEAIARSLDHDYENAELMLRHAEEYINDRNAEQSREWYLTAAGVTSFAIIAVAFVAWLSRAFWISLTGEFVFFLYISASAGALGALFSVIMRIGNVVLNSAAGKRLHYLEAFYRIIAGCISGTIIALAVKLGLILPVLPEAAYKYIAMFFSGLIAGASERWAPSLISKIESVNNKAKKTNHI